MNVRNLQIAVALIIFAMAGLVAVVLILDDSGESDTASNNGRTDVPEFIDAFGPEAPADDTTPVDRTSCEQDERIAWTEARRYVNQKVAVIGAVTSVESGHDGATLTIGRTEDEIPVTVFITENAVDRMPEAPGEMFGDNAVCVIGVLQAVDAEIQVVVDEPADITRF